MADKTDEILKIFKNKEGMTNEQIKKEIGEMWVSGKKSAFVKVGNDLYEIKSVFVTKSDNIIIEVVNG